MLDTTRKIINELLESDKVEGVIGLRKHHGNVEPYVFKKGDSLDTLVLWPKYPMSTICKSIQAAYPEGKLAIVARGCDERALIELAKRNQVKMDTITLIGVACTGEQAKECVCSLPYPQKIDVGDKVSGFSTSDEIEMLTNKSVDERLSYWKDEFAKCIKCYGCRNACPLCICDQCILEDEAWVKAGEVPPNFPSFHLIRAFHLSDKCVNCGECQKACPMDIPLTSLYVMMRKEFNELFDYDPGESIDRQSPLSTTLEQEPIKEVVS